MPEAVEAKRAGCSIYQPFPEAAKRLPQAVRVPNSNEFPPNWEQSAITQFVESCINEQHHAAIRFRADDPTDGLQHAIHAWKGVSKIKSRRILPLKIIADQIPFDTKLRQAYADDNRADQALADEVYPFAENSTQHGEPSQRFTMLN